MRMQQVRAKHRIALGGWESASAFDLHIWEIVSRFYGLGCVCEDCLQDACPQVVSIISTREAYADEGLRQYLQASPPPPPVLSTSKELERAPEEPVTQSRREAA